MKKLFSIIICAVMLLSTIPFAAQADPGVDGNHSLFVDGRPYTTKEVANYLYGDGWKWNPDTATITLNGYDGGCIAFLNNLTVVIADGSDNVVTNHGTAANDKGEHVGIYAGGYLGVIGEGDLTVEADDAGLCSKGSEVELDLVGNVMLNSGIGISAGGDVSVSGRGDLRAESSSEASDAACIKAGGTVTLDGEGAVSLKCAAATGKKIQCGIAADSGVLIGGNRTVSIKNAQLGIMSRRQFRIEDTASLDVSFAGTGIVTGDAADIATSGSVRIYESYDGIMSAGDLTVSGPAWVDIVVYQIPVHFKWNENRFLKLESFRSLIALESSGVSPAIVRERLDGELADTASAIAGAAKSTYMSGNYSGEKSVCLSSERLTVDGENFDGSALLSDIKGKGWSWDSDTLTLILDGYDGGVISADGNLNVEVKAGAENRITESDRETHGIYASGALDLSVRGKLYVDIYGFASVGIKTGGPLVIDGDGYLSCNSSIVCASCGSMYVKGSLGIDMDRASNGCVSSLGSVIFNGIGDVSFRTSSFGAIGTGYEGTEVRVDRIGSMKCSTEFGNSAIPGGSEGTTGLVLTIPGKFLLQGSPTDKDFKLRMNIYDCSEPFSDCITDGTQITDMPAQGYWSHRAIEHCLRTGLMNGTGASTFSPKGTMTRAMVVTVLWRMAGEPAPKGTSPFRDLTQDWYRTAVTWASENGIVNGVAADRFAPDTPVTREQLATILLRFTKKGMKLACSNRTDVSGFPDYSDVSEYAVDAMSWANFEGLIGGSDVGGVAHLLPKNNATREQVATILMRYCMKVVR